VSSSAGPSVPRSRTSCFHVFLPVVKVRFDRIGFLFLSFAAIGVSSDYRVINLSHGAATTPPGVPALLVLFSFIPNSARGVHRCIRFSTSWLPLSLTSLLLALLGVTHHLVHPTRGASANASFPVTALNNRTTLSHRAGSSFSADSILSFDRR
jgi:hypothetical protein